MTDHHPLNKEEQTFTSAFTPVPAPAIKEEALAHLLRWLSLDKEQAGLRYENLRRRLIELFARRGAPSFVLDELADDTLDRVGRKLAAGEVIQNPEPMAYIHGVACNVLNEYWRQQSRRVNHEVPIEDITLRDQEALEANRQHQLARQEMERRLECLDKFLKKLPPEEERLLRTCHHDDPRQQAKNRRAAARQLGLEESSLRVHLRRIRQTLERKIQACVERQEK